MHLRKADCSTGRRHSSTLECRVVQCAQLARTPRVLRIGCAALLPGRRRRRATTTTTATAVSPLDAGDARREKLSACYRSHNRGPLMAPVNLFFCLSGRSQSLSARRVETAPVAVHFRFSFRPPSPATDGILCLQSRFADRLWRLRARYHRSFAFLMPPAHRLHTFLALAMVREKVVAISGGD